MSKSGKTIYLSQRQIEVLRWALDIFECEIEELDKDPVELYLEKKVIKEILWKVRDEET